MSNLNVLPWLNENELRAFPLTSDSNRYFYRGKAQYDLYLLVLDALLQAPSITDPVQLTQIQTTATDLVFTVTGQASFTVPGYATATYPYYARNSQNSVMTIGRYAKTLSINQTFKLTSVVFEASTTFEIPAAMLGITSLTIGDTSLTGAINLNDGYQTSLIPGESIDIEVGRNEGLPLPCGNVRGITPDCSAVVSSINGVTANKTGNPVKFLGSEHVVIYDDANNNRIYIGFDFKFTDVPSQQLLSPPVIV